MPQIGGQGSHRQGSQVTIDGDDPRGLDLLRCCVVPTAPTGLTGPLPQNFFADGTHVILEEEVPDETTTQEVAPAVAKDKRRSKNFSADEDILFVSAWLNVTLDAIQGIEQSRNTYWKRIHDYFYANKKFESDRSQGSLMNRWSGIQNGCECMCNIQGRGQAS